jgi:hypothetical protein
MTNPAFDTLKYVETLTENGNFTPEQARVLSFAQQQAIDSNIATKDDIKDIKQEIKNVESNLRQEIKDVNNEIKDVKNELKDDIKELRHEFKEEFSSLKLWFYGLFMAQIITVFGLLFTFVFNHYAK